MILTIPTRLMSVVLLPVMVAVVRVLLEMEILEMGLRGVGLVGVGLIGAGLGFEKWSSPLRLKLVRLVGDGAETWA